MGFVIVGGKVVFRVAFVFLLLIGSISVGTAHPGGTAADGCHYCWTNCAQWGEVEGARHCHGNNIEELDPKFTPIGHHEESDEEADDDKSDEAGDS